MHCPLHALPLIASSVHVFARFFARNVASFSCESTLLRSGKCSRFKMQQRMLGLRMQGQVACSALQLPPPCISHAFGAGMTGDDLRPIQGGAIDYLHVHATLFDSLGTLYVLGLHPQFKAAADAAVALGAPRTLLWPTSSFEYVASAAASCVVRRLPNFQFTCCPPPPRSPNAPRCRYNIRIVGGALSAAQLSGAFALGRQQRRLL